MCWCPDFHGLRDLRVVAHVFACFLLSRNISIFVDLLFHRDSLFALENSRHVCLFLITFGDLKGQARSLYLSSNYLLIQCNHDSRLVLWLFSDAK